MEKNQVEIEEKKREKYNPDEIFKDKKEEFLSKNEVLQDSVALVKFKDNVFRRILKKIKSIFSK